MCCICVCRFSHDAAVWACLAALSMAAGELSTAEVAFAAINAVDKLQYVLRLRSLAGSAAATASGADPLVAAELALYAGQPDEAEAKLLQVGLVWLFTRSYACPVLPAWHASIAACARQPLVVPNSDWYKQAVPPCRPGQLSSLRK